MAILMDGKALSEKIKEDLSNRSLHLWSGPRLIIFTNSNPASQVYVRNKVKFGAEIGVKVITKNLYEELSTFRNSHGKGGRYNLEPIPFIIQLPLDKEIKDLFNLKRDEEIFQWFDGNIDLYDMDGFNPYNMGKLTLGLPCVKPCTPAGILRLLAEYSIELSSKRVCIMGRSNIVGKPLAQMMMKGGATVTNIHTNTPFFDQLDIVHNSDIVVSATGNRDAWKLFGKQDLPDVVVDVGMNRDENGKLCGDIPTDLLEFCTHITPVPGGVGPMTVAMLFNNVVEFYEKEEQRWGIYR